MLLNNVTLINSYLPVSIAVRKGLIVPAGSHRASAEDVVLNFSDFEKLISEYRLPRTLYPLVEFSVSVAVPIGLRISPYQDDCPTGPEYDPSGL